MDLLKRVFFGVSFSPGRTLLIRLLKRLVWIGKYLLAASLNKSGFQGFKNVGDLMDGRLQKLESIKASLLAKKGEIILLPEDEVMYKFVKAYGYWEVHESKFFISRINELETEKRLVLLDIGANCGLITRQVLNGITHGIKVVAVEPLPSHLVALESNLKPFRDLHEINVIDAALDFSPGEKTIHRNLKNSGDTSLVEPVNSMESFEKEIVKTLSPLDFANEFVDKNFKIFLKIDIQGLEAEVLKTFNFWDDVYAAVIEISALKSIRKSDVAVVLNHFSKLDQWYWDSNPSVLVQKNEVERFWLSGTSEVRNLFLARG
jgi:FkbM family methyltransferase